MPQLKTAECLECGLFEEQKVGTPCLAPTGAERPKIYVLGQSPGAEEVEAERQFVGKSGKLLRFWFQRAWGNRFDFERDLRWNNAVRCFPPDHKVKPKHLKCCRRSVIEDVKKSRPKVIVAVGGEALKQLIGETRRAVKISVYRGYVIPFHEYDAWVVSIYHPSGLLRNPDEEIEKVTINDLRKVLSYVNRPLPSKKEGKVVVLTSEKEILEVLKKFENKREFAFDFETSSPDYFRPEAELLSTAISDGRETYAFRVDSDKIRKGLKRLFETSNARKIAHNLKFELNWIRTRLNCELKPPYEDTMLLSHVLDPRKETHSLKFQAFVRLGVEDYGVDVFDLVEKRMWRELLIYNGLDAYYTYLLYKELSREIYPEGYECYKKLLCPAVEALSHGEIGGLVVNEEFVREKKKEFAELAEKAKGKIPSDLNVNSTPQLRKHFFEVKKYEPLKKTAKGQNSVDEATLKKFAEELKDPVAKAILDHRKALKMLKTYIENVEKKAVGGILRPNYNLHGTETGRLSSSGGVNTQNFPKRKLKEMRNIFKAPDGYVILSLDYSQLEFRVAVSLMNAEPIIEMIKEGLDVHLHWAERIFGKDLAQEKRNTAKNGFVFPALYGAGAKTVASGLGISETEAKKHLKAFFEEYPMVKKWQYELKEFYDRRGYVETPLGRRRYAPLGWNELINFPVQSVASDLCLYSYVKIYEFVKEKGLSWWAPLIIHDEIDLYVPLDELEFAYYVCKRIMENPGWKFEKILKTPMEVDAKVGYKWGSLVSIEEILK